MPSGQPVTEEKFRLVKAKLLERSLDPTADTRSIFEVVSLHPAIVMKIAASADYEEYKRISKAEHPPVKHSLRDEIEDLKRRLDHLESICEVQERIKTEKALVINADVRKSRQ